MKTMTAQSQSDTKTAASKGRRITLRLCYAAVSVALITVCSWVSVPFLTVPFTLQTFAVFFVIGLLGTKWSLFAILAYIALGAVGAPVFSGFGAGIGKLMGPTGGYIVGFLAAVAVTGPLCKLSKDNPVFNYLSMLAGLAVCYLFGTLWFMHVAGSFTWHGFGSALMLCVVPFIVVDLLKLALADFLLYRLKPSLTKSLR